MGAENSVRATLSEGFFNYFVTNGEARLTAYEGPRDTNVNVPASLGNFPVTRLGNSFKRLGISGITLPPSLQRIERNAFASCSNLTSLTIPEGVTVIEGASFWECTSLTNVVLPDSLLTLTDGNFYGCRSLRSIRLPPGVVNLDHQNFRGCSALTNVVITGNVTNIGDFVFASCRSLTNVVLPASLVSLGEEAFADCTNLASLVFLGNAPNRGTHPFDGNDKLTVFYLEGKTGWQPFMDGRPTKMIPARATIVRSPIASSLRVGQVLSNSVLSGGSNTVAGSFGFALPATTYATPGTYSATVVFTPESPYTQPAETTVQVRVLVNNPELIGQSLFLPRARLGQPFTHTLSASNHTGFAADGLPPGLSLDRISGVLSGTPQETGNFAVQFMATNADGTNTVPLNLRVYRGTPKIQEQPVVTPIWAGQPLRFARLSGGRATREDGSEEIPGLFRWALPDRVADPRATPQRVEFHPDDSLGYEVASFSMAPNTYRITSDTNVADLNLGAPFLYPLSANLASATFRASRLPPGLRIENPPGRVIGKPRRAGVYRVAFTATAPGAQILRMEKTLRVLQMPSIRYPADLVVLRNRSFRVTPKVSGFPAPRFSLAGGILPTGLDLDAASGMIRGTVLPGAASSSVLIRATNDAGAVEARVNLILR